MKPKDHLAEEAPEELDFDEHAEEEDSIESEQLSTTPVASNTAALARQRIEYLQELKRLRTLLGDDMADDLILYDDL
jgi:hypothetical protein